MAAIFLASTLFPRAGLAEEALKLDAVAALAEIQPWYQAVQQRYYSFLDWTGHEGPQIYQGSRRNYNEQLNVAAFEAKIVLLQESIEVHKQALHSAQDETLKARLEVEVEQAEAFLNVLNETKVEVAAKASAWSTAYNKASAKLQSLQAHGQKDEIIFSELKELVQSLPLVDQAFADGYYKVLEVHDETVARLGRYLIAAEAAIEAIEIAYSKRKSRHVLKWISEDFSPSQQALTRSVEDEFKEFKNAHLEHAVKYFALENDTLQMRMAWKKKIVHKESGVELRTDGVVVYSFIMDGDKARIVKLEGDQPLGSV